jgi:uncharacterized protein
VQIGASGTKSDFFVQAESKKVAGKTERRIKHVPQRTCVGCHLVLPKRSLIRIVRGAQGITVDSTGKASGRGAYLHNRRSCWERGIKGSLAHALKVDLTEQDMEIFKAFMRTLPEESTDELISDSEQVNP